MFTLSKRKSEHFVNIEERLNKLRHLKGMTWLELGACLEISRTMLHYVRNGERKMSLKSARRLRDEEQKAGLKSDPYTDLVDPNELMLVERPILSGIKMPILRNEGGPYWGTTNLAPVIAFARGGVGAYPEDQGLDVPHVPVTCMDPNCYVLELEGDSMEPIYSEGDLLVVAPNLQVSPGDLVIVKTMADETLFKKYQPRGKTLQLQSYNPKHPMIELKLSDIRKMHAVQSVIRVLKGKKF